MKKGIIITIVVLLIAFVVVRATDKPEEDVIRVGAVLSLSGIAAADGESILEGLRLAQKDLKEDGIEVELYVEDDSTEVPDTVSALRKIITLNDPHAIVGPTWSFLATAGASVIDDENILSFQPANTSEFVDTLGAPIFFGNIQVAKKEKQLVELFTELDVKRVAVIADNTGWGVSHKLPYTRATEAVGAEFVFYEEVTFGAGDILTALTKIDDADADIILWTGGLESESVEFLKRHTELGLDIPIVGLDILVDGNRKEIAQQVQADIYTIDGKVSQDFVDKYVAEYGREPEQYTDIAYDGLMMIVEAVHETDGSRQAVIDYFRNDIEYKGYFTNYKFNADGDIEGGEWELKKFEK